MILLRRRNRIKLISMKVGPITLDYMRMQRQSMDRITNSHAVPAGRGGWGCYR